MVSEFFKPSGLVLILCSIGFIFSYLLGYYHGLEDAKNHKVMLRRVVQALQDLIERHNF